MNLKIEIEKMEKNHIEHIVKIERECFSEPWSHNGLAAELYSKNSYFIVAKINTNVIGYAGMHCICGDCYITNIAVLSSFRRMGIGKTLVKNLIDYSKSQNFNFISLEVRKSNEIAKSLYKNLGFKDVGIRKHFYKNPQEDAIIMNYYI